MQVRRIFRAIRPFISAIAVTATAAMLVSAIYYTELEPQWITFLAGILVAAILAEATRISRAEWLAIRRTAQLAAVRDRLDREIQLRKRAEGIIAASKPRLQLIDEALSTMVAFIDIEGCCQYHNRAFMEWLHLRPEQIHGRHAREVLGTRIYEETAAAIRQSLDGHAVHYERRQKMPDGAVYRFLVEHIPQFTEGGKVTGFYMLISDITAPSDVHPSGLPESRGSANDAGRRTLTQAGKSTQDMFVDSFAEQITGQRDANRIMAAIENGSFRLFCQLITPITADSGETGHHEILVRLMEEEEGMMPPGEFFPLVEKHGLMPHLDRWVVRHVTEWASRRSVPGGKQPASIFFINVSGATITDAGFPEFLRLTLLEHSVAGATLCFEIPNPELSSKASAVTEFAQRVRQCGCRIAISGFGRDRVLFDLIRGFQVEFLKIDGSIIFNLLRDSVDLAKATAINRVAKKIGVKTIAELVESEETIAKLREVGVDFAQGFGISRPQPLEGQHEP